ncbi:MAG: ParA family protein [Burkholderiaceae bacterium]|jgi:chromosome partitioning protein|nr:ParA family protein [Burkholderiaceae bacterium]
MAQIFCITNQKGGVAKTTTAINLAAGLAQMGKRVLLVDLDPQGNASMGSGINKFGLERSVYHVLLGWTGANEVRQATQWGYDVLPSNRDLSGAELELTEVGDRDARLRLKGALQKVEGQYDYVLIDCPPALSLLTVNGLAAADGVVIPMQCEYFAMEGLADLVNTIRVVRRNFNEDLQLIGVLRVMFDTRITLQADVSEQLKQHFGDKVFETIIPRNVRLAEASSFGMPGIVFDKSSRGAEAYVDFSKEMLIWLDKN